MKKVIVKKRDLFDKKAKITTIYESTPDKDCTTNIEKRFVYIINPNHSRRGAGEKPDIHVRKSFDAQHNKEVFHLHVKGVTSMEKDGQSYQVDFAHSLKININWNTRFLSPEQSAAVA